MRRLVAHMAILAALATACGEAPSSPDDGGSHDAQDARDAGDDAPFFPGLPDPFAPGDASVATRARLVLRSCGGIGPEVACHSTGAGGTRLMVDPDGGDLLNVASIERPDLARVAPGDPWRSYVVLKVAGDGGIDGGRMPRGGPFDPRTLDLLVGWIEAGAP